MNNIKKTFFLLSVRHYFVLMSIFTSFFGILSGYFLNQLFITQHSDKYTQSLFNSITNNTINQALSYANNRYLQKLVENIENYADFKIDDFAMNQYLVILTKNKLLWTTNSAKDISIDVYKDLGLLDLKNTNRVWIIDGPQSYLISIKELNTTKQTGYVIYGSLISNNLFNVEKNNFMDITFSRNEKLIASSNKNLFNKVENDLQIYANDNNKEIFFLQSEFLPEYNIFFTIEKNQINLARIILISLAIITFLAIISYLYSNKFTKLSNLFLNNKEKEINNIYFSTLEDTIIADFYEKNINNTNQMFKEVNSKFTILSETFEQQLQNLSIIISNVEEMSNQTQLISNNCRDLSNLSEDSNRNASLGGEVIVETISAIDKVNLLIRDNAITVYELQKSSDEIGQIISVINGIAEQTNLLALNASIEAARAGETGKGFAVVADEVRKLAEETTHATKEIGKTIEKIQRNSADAVKKMNLINDVTEKGVKLAKDAGSALSKIVEQSQDLSVKISYIENAVENQLDEIRKTNIKLNDTIDIIRSDIYAKIIQ